MSRKLTALMLSVFMVLSLFAPLSNLKAQDANLNDGIHNQRPVDLESAIDYKALDEVSDKEEERSFIFVTDESSKVAEKVNEAYEAMNANEVAEKGIAHLMKSGFNDAISGAMKNLDFNSEVKEKINSVLGRHQEGLLYSLKSMFFGNRDDKKEVEDEGRDFNVVFSGFTMKMTTKEAMKVRESVPEVKQIFIDYKYNRPDEKPSMYSSAGMVGAPDAWKLKYKGEGRVVAVVDSGADITHPAMRLSETTKPALTEEIVKKLISENLLKGQYLTPKFPYGYNFMDHDMNLKDTNPKLGMHGMHVSGTVGANATKEEADENSGGLIIKGIAPEAQILVMRVFSDDKDNGGTNTSAYIEAIEESIILGADSINMSLGSMSGSEDGIDLGMQAALDSAKAAGTIIAIAGGNDFYTTKGNGNPRATNPDWGVMGTPGVAESAFTVANYNNDSMMVSDTVVFKDENDKDVIIISEPSDRIKTADFSKFVPNKDCKYVDVGLGKDPSDYENKAIEGNIALIKRGGASFAEKIALAGKYGAAAVVMGDHGEEGEDVLMIMSTETDGLIPGYFISFKDYKVLKERLEKLGDKATIRINTNAIRLDNTHKYEMNASSSWGPNPKLRLKPEITAPGGDIYSTVNVDNGRYQSMTGTSMATPHVAGGIALVNQFLDENKIIVNKADKNQFIKNLMMATATPILYKNNPDYYYSPRIQGAGLMNLKNAVNKNIITVVDQGQEMSRGKAVVEFGSIHDGKLAFNLKLHNYSKKAATYKVHGIAQTDAVKNGMITFAPLNLAKEDDMGTVTVQPGVDAEFKGTIDFSRRVAAQKLAQPKGFFVDGFIFFESVSTAEGKKEFADLSVPFLAFRGDWANLPVIDVLPDEAFQETADGTTWSSTVPFWYQGMGEASFPGDGFNNWNFTHFYSRWNNGERFIQGYQVWTKKFLDTYAISPNGDMNKDDLSFRGVFLRNADSLKFEFFNEKGDVIRSIEEPYNSVVIKSSHKNKFAENQIWVWRGEDKNGGQVPDGNYKVKVSAKAQDNSGTLQYKERKVIVDRVKPELELIKAEKTDETTVEFEFKAKDDRSGMDEMFVYGMIDTRDKDKNKHKEYPYIYNYTKSGEYLVYNAKYTVEKGFDFDKVKDNIFVIARDMAGNFIEKRVTEPNNKGKVTFELKSKDQSDTSFPKELPVLYYPVDKTNPDGDWKYTTDTTNLDYGFYKPDYNNRFPEYNVEFNPDRVELTQEKPEANIQVIFTKKKGVEDYGILRVNVVNVPDYGGEINLFAVANYGQKDKDIWYRLPGKAGYSRDIFEAKLPAGEYTIVAEGTGIYPPELELGTTPLVLKSREKVAIDTRLVFYGEWISMRLGTYGYTLGDVFGEDIIEVDAKNDDGSPKKDEDGNQIKLNIIKNLNNYFDIIDKQTGKVKEVTKAYIFDFSENTEERYQEFTLDILGLSGEYIVVSKFDLDKYKVENPTIEITSMYDNAQRKDKTEYMCLYPADQVKGSLKVDTEFETKDKNDKPNVEYKLYDSRNKLVNDWTNLYTGDYTLRTEVQNGYRPERNEYKISITTEELNVTQKVRWYKLSEETRKNPIVEFGLGGAYASDYGKPVSVEFISKDNPSLKYSVSIPIGKVKYDKIPVGEYEMNVKVDDDWDYIFYTRSGNDGDKSQGNPDEVIFTEAYNFIEIHLIKKEKPVYKTNYKLVINENGLDGVTARPNYILVDSNDEVRYRTNKAEFINITPGDYKLKVIGEPTGFTASPKEIDVKIVEVTNPTTTDPIATQVTVTYTKSTNKLNIKSVVVDKDGKPIDNPVDPLVVEYEAYSVENNEKTIYDIGSLPIGVELTVVPKNVKAPYALYEEDKDGKQVKLTGTDEPNIEFRYVVSNENLNTRELDKAIAEAKDLLENAKLEPEYKKALAEALKAAEDYLKGNDKTQQGVIDAANDLWKVVDAAVYMVTVTIDPDNETEPTSFDILQGEKVTKPADPTKPGFTFEGWYLGDEEFDFTTNIMRDITLKAKWNLIFVPTPTPTPTPEEPSVPHRPYRPNRPNRPVAPTKDVAKTTPVETKPVEKPVEEKKDYGIVETMPTIAATFSDLPENAAAGSIMNMVARGILKGMDNGKFEGELPITRAMVATVLKRLSKDQTINTVQNFKDVKATDWFADAVKWAQSQGLIKGYEDGTFKANNLVTRQELAIIVERFLKAHGITMDEIKELSYKDLDTLPAWSKDAIIAMAKIGLVEGQTEEMYNPASQFTREELAVMLEKIIIWVEKH